MGILRGGMFQKEGTTSARALRHEWQVTSLRSGRIQGPDLGCFVLTGEFGFYSVLGSHCRFLDTETS